MSITWVINIDVIKHLTYSYDDTRMNYIAGINAINPNIDIVFLPQQANPSFTLAVKNMALYMNDHMVAGDMLFWLEDDWICRDDTYTLDQYCAKLNPATFSIVNLIPKCKISLFYPMIRTYSAARYFIETMMYVTETVRDPEIYSKAKTKLQPLREFIFIGNGELHTFIHQNTRLFKGTREWAATYSDVRDYNNNNRAICMNDYVFADAGRQYIADNRMAKRFNTGDHYTKL